jgi:preprotein translocase subunit SecD
LIRAAALVLALVPWPARADLVPFALEGSKGQVLVPGPDIASAEPGFDQSGNPSVNVTLKPAFDGQVRAFSLDHVGETIRVLICGDIVLEPRLMTQLDRASFVVTVESVETATRLALLLQRGSCDPKPVG